MSRFARSLPLLLLAALVAALPGPTPADDVPPTRKITLRWQQTGEVKGFKVYVRYWGQKPGRPIDIGLPKLVDGVYTHSLEVSNLQASYISISSYNRYFVESERSNENEYLLD